MTWLTRVVTYSMWSSTLPMVKIAMVLNWFSLNFHQKLGLRSKKSGLMVVTAVLISRNG